MISVTSRVAKCAQLAKNPRGAALCRYSAKWVAGLAGLENLRACLCDRHRLTFRPRIGESTVAKRHAGGIHDRLLVHDQRADFARESPIEYTTNARQRTEQPNCAAMFITRAQQRCVLENGVTHRCLVGGGAGVLQCLAVQSTGCIPIHLACRDVAQLHEQVWKQPARVDLARNREGVLHRLARLDRAAIVRVDVPQNNHRIHDGHEVAGFPSESNAFRELRIAALGGPGLLLATAGNGWMRGVQDTRRPLRYVLGANLLSAALCPILVY